VRPNLKIEIVEIDGYTERKTWWCVRFSLPFLGKAWCEGTKSEEKSS
jgi:hypothetical protein